MSVGGDTPGTDLRIGLVLLDRYRVVRKLGEGGMGDVYEGVHELIGKKLAIKCMHQDFAANVEAVNRFKQEARAATSVGNEHIVDVSDIGTLPDGSPFMVMEYLKGQELAGLIESEDSLPIQRVIKIALEILEALKAAHESGVVHRDMKPENVFLVERGGNRDFVKVLDFGISMIAEHADAAKGRMTQTGVAMGTPHYMSPEQAKGARDVDLRTDLYSVGVILYQALTRQVPFQSSSLAVLMTKILTENPKPIRELRPDVPDSLDRIILRAMAKEADIRFEDADEFADALRPYLDPQYVAAVEPTKPRIDHATVRLQSSTSDLPPPSQASKPLSDNTAQLPFGGALPSTSTGADRTERIDSARLPDGGKPAFSSETLLAAGIARRGTKKWAALAVTGVVIIGGGLVAFGLGGNDAKGTTSVAKQGPTPPMVNERSPTPSVKEVQVTINATPSKAKVYIDGNPFPNAVKVARSRSLAPTRVQVVLDGYQAVDTVTVFDQDRELSFELKKSSVGAAEKTAANVIPETSKTSKKRPRGDGKSSAKEPKVQLPKETTKPSNENPKNTDKKKNDPGVYSGSQGTVRDRF